MPHFENGNAALGAWGVFVRIRSSMSAMVVKKGFEFFFDLSILRRGLKTI